MGGDDGAAEEDMEKSKRSFIPLLVLAGAGFGGLGETGEVMDVKSPNPLEELNPR